MALIHSKQLNPNFTGSYIFSGSNPLDVVGGLSSDTLTTSGNITAIGNVSSSGNLFVTQNVDVDGTSNFAGNMLLQNDLTTLGNLDIDGTSNFAGDVVLQNDLSLSGHITASGNISASGTVYASKFESAGTSDEIISFNDNLNVTGNITGSGNLEIAGNISGSSSTTGSFGKLFISDDTHLNTNGFSISGSSNSTASFGMVKIHAIAGNSPITFADTIIQQQNIEVAGHITASGNISNVSTTHVTASGNVEVGGDLNVSQYIYHKDDSNTYLNFTNDRLRFNIGGISYIDLNDAGSAPHDITFNDGGNNVDLIIKGSSNNPLFKTDASTNRIGTHGKGTPEVAFHIGGSELRVDGNISGSSTGTGSFGELEVGTNATIGGNVEVTSDIHASGNISGSSATFNNAVSASKVYAADGFYHSDDVGENTYIKFPTGDKIYLVAGGVNFLYAWQKDSDVNKLIFNEDNTDTDIIFRGENENNLLHLDASTDRVGIGTSSPGVELEVIGDISGSSTSTGSFGYLEATNILFELDNNGDIMPI